MNTTHNRKKLVASALGAAVPAVLFFGAGTAQADTEVTFEPGATVGLPPSVATVVPPDVSNSPQICCPRLIYPAAPLMFATPISLIC